MATQVGNLNVKVTANTKQFNTSMNKAAGTSKRFGKDVKTSVGGVDGVLSKINPSALAAAAGMGVLVLAAKKAVSTFVDLTKEGAAFVDRIGKLSTQTGVSAESLSSLSIAAERGGTTLDNLAKGMQKMGINVSMAATGFGAARNSLKLLNLDAKVLTQLPLREQLDIIADAMAGLENQTDRLRVAQELFGKAGLELLPTLAGGSAGLAEFSDKAKLLGLEVSNAQAAAVEEMNDSMADLADISKGLGTQFAVELAPAVTSLAKEILGLVEDSGGVEGIATGFNSIADAVRGAAGAIETMRGAMKELEGLTGVKFNKFVELGLSSLGFGFDALRILGGPGGPDKQLTDATVPGQLPTLKAPGPPPGPPPPRTRINPPKFKLSSPPADLFAPTVSDGAFKAPPEIKPDRVIPTPGLPQAALRGSAAAISAVNRARNPELDVARETLVETKKLVANTDPNNQQPEQVVGGFFSPTGV